MSGAASVRNTNQIRNSRTVSNITIHTKKIDGFTDFLQIHGFEVEELENDIYRVVREDELPVFIKVGDETIYFEVDLGNISGIAGEELLFKLLDANTEILPVSFGINNSNPDDPRLVLAESRVTGDLSDGEVLSVFDALELAADRAEEILQPYLG
jgi:hypothetical protein